LHVEFSLYYRYIPIMYGRESDLAKNIIGKQFVMPYKTIQVHVCH
jgi:hypothetical protein